MDNYTHLYIEDLRPIAEKLAVKWKEAAARRAAEKEAEAVMTRFSSKNTVFVTATSGVEQHSRRK